MCAVEQQDADDTFDLAELGIGVGSANARDAFGDGSPAEMQFSSFAVSGFGGGGGAGGGGGNADDVAQEEEQHDRNVGREFVPSSPDSSNGGDANPRDGAATASSAFDGSDYPPPDRDGNDAFFHDPQDERFVHRFPFYSHVNSIGRTVQSQPLVR